MVIKVKDDILGEIAFRIPKGYRFVPLNEYAKRRRRAMRTDDWDDLENVYIFDPGLKGKQRFLPISCMPYRWRCFVEKVAS